MTKSRSTQREYPYLKFTSGIREGERIQLVSDVCIIGRDPEMAIRIASPFVSRQHAEIRLEGGYWFIMDLHSKNGVFKNLVRLHPGKATPLVDGDRVQIGSVSAFVFQDPEATIHDSQIRRMSPGLWLDEENRDVFIYDQRLEPPLSPQQYILLTALVHKEGDVLTNEEIADCLWPDAAGGVSNAAIDNAISRLNHRLRELDATHDYIETVRGVGRRFVQRKLEM
jgi:pSer/pThr/pTyr-binding forkhead associated (FHA) protein